MKAYMNIVVITLEGDAEVDSNGYTLWLYIGNGSRHWLIKLHPKASFECLYLVPKEYSEVILT